MYIGGTYGFVYSATAVSGSVSSRLTAIALRDATSQDAATPALPFKIERAISCLMCTCKHRLESS